MRGQEISGFAVIENPLVPSREPTRGLDTLRLIAAAWVAASHGARFPIDHFIQPDSAFHKLLFLFGKTIFNGTAAVAVFFVLSGFIIHSGNLNKPSIPIAPFLIRRLIRIGAPLAVIWMIASVLGSNYVDALDDILWSVYAELVYYLIYPFTLPYVARYGVKPFLACSLIISLAMIVSNPSQIYLWSFGIGFTWLFCAPLWLLGCALAEDRRRIDTISGGISPWWFRFGALAYCLLSTILATHAGDLAVGYTWTIMPFGVFCMFWIASEMLRAKTKIPNSVLEKLGTAGYSIYLVHKLPITYFEAHLTGLAPIVYWALLVTCISASVWTFYRAVEWPAHVLARRLGRNKPSAALPFPA